MQQSSKVIIGLSGGVDSGVAAYLLLKAGYDVHAVFMVNWKERGSCAWEQDLLSARSVAKSLSIPLSIWDFSDEYKKFVFSDFIRAYRLGLTPNPDVFCNKFIKFGSFYRRARASGAQFVATGHYARILRQENRPSKSTKGDLTLFSAVDKTKDQSDFLYQIKQSQLKHILFPLGEMHKVKVKELAKKIGLANWNRPESMGVCFIGEMNIKKFLQTYIKPKQGTIVDTDGNVLGGHNGVWYYTLGQREGLNIGGTGPYFVVKKDIQRNIVIVAKDPDAGMLLIKRVILTKCNFFLPAPMLQARGRRLRVLWRDRHLSSLQKGTVVKEKTNIVVAFDKPKRAVAPGQSLVMYDLKGEKVLGGGVIQRAYQV